jgi:2Fe-2S ferredoxin
MPKIIIKPHSEICPKGAEIEAEKGSSLCEAMLDNKINIEHACELSCACTTCHVIVTSGFDKLNEASEDEEDLLDKAWGLEQRSRLSCQIILDEDDLEIEIPKYNINMVSENPH